ncbi:hypothetical protein T440DRAFT_473567 [Plenodomus tracheiphilus IPT5]|uniref:Zn(2)-C6 fungal-type domain-containing protein n=1 Tax=Plenodomus tracheiphilus IPT5 TaxID=1408161 RepID=A0A6A7AML0_9PLEO|nr:hypothetical protein T440DRAFT_473567 [Plenodomus tracheiphilus IPT5]
MIDHVSAVATSSQSTQDSPTSQRPPTHSQQPRFRQACDSCTAAKVKCDKGRPACQRCLDNDELCQYSPSRRHGKRARRSQTAVEHTTPLLASESGAIPPQPPKAAAEQYITQDSSVPLSWHALNQTSVSEDMIPTYTSGPELDISDLLLWSNFERPEYMSPEDPDSILATHISLLERGSTGEEGAICVETFSGDGAEEPKNATEHALECEERALNVLRSLLYSPTLSTRERKEEVNSINSLDTMLATNKAAMSDLAELLECGCAENPHVALLHLTTLSKIVFWYNVVVTARYYSENVDLKPMKIQFGVLDLDDDDYAPLHRVMLCRELQKAGNIVRAFEVRFASSSMSVSGNETPWGRTIIRAIREDLERCVREVEKPQLKPF